MLPIPRDPRWSGCFGLQSQPLSQGTLGWKPLRPQQSLRENRSQVDPDMERDPRLGNWEGVNWSASSGQPQARPGQSSNGPPVVFPHVSWLDVRFHPLKWCCSSGASMCCSMHPLVGSNLGCFSVPLAWLGSEKWTPGSATPIEHTCLNPPFGAPEKRCLTPPARWRTIGACQTKSRTRGRRGAWGGEVRDGIRGRHFSGNI